MPSGMMVVVWKEIGDGFGKSRPRTRKNGMFKRTTGSGRRRSFLFRGLEMVEFIYLNCSRMSQQLWH